MASRISSFFFLLCVLFISQVSNINCAPGSEPADISDAPEVQVFFKLEDLRVGNRLPFFFKIMSATKTHFLPKEKADAIPFSSKQFPEILELFNFSKDSSQAQKMAMTHLACERPPALREIKFCANSMESMTEQVRGLLGQDANINVLTSKLSPNHKIDYQNYTILGEPKKVDTHKQLGCHVLPYPYKVYFCHTQMRDHMIFKIPMLGDDGERIEAVGACHSDTAMFNPEHVAFKVLKTKPGATVCHIMQSMDYFFVSTPTTV